MYFLTVPARINELTAVTEYIDEILENLGCPMKIKLQLDVAVDEIFTNIASYAYQGEVGECTIKVETLNESEGVKIAFIDNGAEYNPLKKEDPDITLSAEERPIGGLGIFIVKKTMDEVLYSYEDGNNVLTIIKRFK